MTDVNSIPQLLLPPFRVQNGETIASVASDPTFGMLTSQISSFDVQSAQDSSQQRKSSEYYRMAILMHRLCNPRCANCCLDLNQTLNVCGKCQVVYYCNVDCQVQHWKDSHRQRCKK